MDNGQLKTTVETRKIERILHAYFPESPPEYPPKAYRYNEASIRVRVVSKLFEGKSRLERERLVYPILREGLPEDTWQDVTLVLLFTPEEIEDALINREFEHPSPMVA